MEDRLPRMIDGRYRLDARIGEGGMGVVYRGRHLVLDREVAIKVVRGDFALDESARKRFVNEARASGRIRNEHVVEVFDSGRTTEGELYLVMELLAGAPLSAHLRRTKLLAPREAVGIALQICDALQAAHLHGVVHRDLKPANVMLLASGDGPAVKVLDFGVAKITHDPGATTTRSGAVVGTPVYLSPEQALGRGVDGRSDVYALGVLLYEALTGSPPFEAETLGELVVLHVTEPVEPPAVRAPAAGISPALDAAVLRCLAKRPADRFPTMAEVAAALAAAIDGARAGQAMRETFGARAEAVRATLASQLPELPGGSTPTAPAVGRDLPTAPAPRGAAAASLATPTHQDRRAPGATPGGPASHRLLASLGAAALAAVALGAVAIGVGLTLGPGSAAAPVEASSEAPAPRRPGAVRVVSSSPAAQVFVNDAAIGGAPALMQPESFAPLRIRVEADGAVPFETTFSPLEGEGLVQAELVALAPAPAPSPAPAAGAPLARAGRRSLSMTTDPGLDPRRRSAPAALLLAAVAASLLVPPRAQAEAGPAARIGRAERAIVGERWCEAAVLLLLAHDAGGEAKLLLNAAIAAEKGGDRALAAELFDRFAKISPLSKLQQPAERDAARVARRVEREGPGEPCPRELPPDPAVEVAAAAAPPAALAPPAPSGERPPASLRPAGWALAGIGAASFVAGVAFTWSANGQISELETLASGTPPPVFDSNAQELERGYQQDRAFGIAGLAGGVVLGGAGAVLLLLVPADPQQAPEGPRGDASP